MTCSFEGCEKKKDSHGLCAGHALQKRRGLELKPLIFKYRGEWTLDVLLENTKKVGDCLERQKSYSVIRFGDKMVGAHRLAYMLATGENIDGRSIHHICANNKCINPEHLQPASRAENTLEMMSRRDYEAEIAQLKEKVAALEAQLEREWELV